MDLLSYKLGKKAGGGGGGGSSLDWEAIGFSSQPKSIEDGYNYAKTIQSNYNDNTSYKNDYNLVYFPYVDTSNRISFYQLFYNCVSLEEVALFDTNWGTSFANMFESCLALKRIPQFDTNKGSILASAFSNCKSLKDVPILDTSSATNMNFMFNGCESLTDASLNNILKMCINATQISASAKTLQRIGLSETQATRCQSLSNYQDFLDAGWTTGY